MHNLKKLRDELIDEAESYAGAIKNGDPENVACLKCLLSAADHADAILDRHGMAEDEEERTGRRTMRRGTMYRGYGDDMSDGGIEPGRATRTRGNDQQMIRELKRLVANMPD